MKKLYQKTFEQALAQTYAPPEQVEAQRSALASRCSKPKSEVTAMTAKPRRPIRILVTAAVVAAALTVGALASSNGILSLTTLFSGAQIVESVGEDGYLHFDITGSTDQERNPVVVRGDRVYFTTETGEELDITGQFSETKPYVYIYTDEDSLTHHIVLGGTPENYSYFEYLYDESGACTAMLGTYPDGYDYDHKPAWLDTYRAEYNPSLGGPDSGQPADEEVVWPEPTLTVSDGKVLLTVDGETTDITGRFSESEAYVRTDEGVDGSTHVILVGGTATEPHTAEFVVDADGTWICSTDAPEDSAWFDAYVEANLSR